MAAAKVGFKNLMMAVLCLAVASAISEVVPSWKRGDLPLFVEFDALHPDLLGDVEPLFLL